MTSFPPFLPSRRPARAGFTAAAARLPAPEVWQAAMQAHGRFAEAAERDFLARRMAEAAERDFLARRMAEAAGPKW